jgi:hypothetical protein
MLARTFILNNADGLGDRNWSCNIGFSTVCVGASFNRAAGTFTVSNTVLENIQGTSPPITMMGPKLYAVLRQRKEFKQGGIP